MDKALFTEYEDIQIKIKELEERRDAIKPHLIQHIPEDSVVKTERGSFTIKRRNTWQYSDYLTSKEEELKKAQAEERQDGTAIEVPGNPYVEYRVNKS